MRVLVLGGTRFLGRAVVDAALGRGHQVTLFNRGQSGPDLYPGLETVIGDRTEAAGLAGLAGRDWDVVVDVAAYQPEVVRQATEALASRAGHYVFVSTVSVYADQRGRPSETDPVLELTEATPADELYGARKAAAERIVTAAFGPHGLNVRAGLIVGPHDPTDRFGYWPRRIARGGRVLAPGAPSDLVQFIDVRDLAAWIVTSAAAGLGGTFNVTGEPMPLGALLDTCLAVTGRTADLAWVDSATLTAAGVDPWMGVPLWIGVPGWEGANDVDVRAALAAGLVTRPLEQTVRDALAWDLARGGPPAGTEGLSAAAEQKLLDDLAPAG